MFTLVISCKRSNNIVQTDYPSKDSLYVYFWGGLDNSEIKLVSGNFLLSDTISTSPTIGIAGVYAIPRNTLKGDLFVFISKGKHVYKKIINEYNKSVLELWIRDDSLKIDFLDDFPPLY